MPGAADLQVPQLDISGVLKAADEEFKPLLAQADELTAYASTRLDEIKAELASIDQQIVRRTDSYQ